MQVQSKQVDRLREGLRTSNWDDFRLMVRRQVAEQNGRVKASPQMAEAARMELAPGGYWHPESVANRIMGFAQAFAGDDPEKQKKALEAVRRGFAEAEKILGVLPDVSKQTRELVEQKFKQWMSGK